MTKEAYYIFFGKLANKLKIEIISALKEKPSSVMQLVKKLKVEQSKLSHALASLRCCNIVLVKRRGKERIYSLNKETMLPILETIDKHRDKFCNCNCNAKNKRGK
jgi:DNA-binding transcriptional ArsR family regulator